jgi:hypothetical protein
MSHYIKKVLSKYLEPEGILGCSLFSEGFYVKTYNFPINNPDIHDIKKTFTLATKFDQVQSLTYNVAPYFSNH